MVQRPAPKDTSLHSALMAAIHSAGGKDRLRKVKFLVGFCLRDGLSPAPTHRSEVTSEEGDQARDAGECTDLILPGFPSPCLWSGLSGTTKETKLMTLVCPHCL